jgi:hypothetical protein
MVGLEKVRPLFGCFAIGSVLPVKLGTPLTLYWDGENLNTGQCHQSELRGFMWVGTGWPLGQPIDGSRTRSFLGDDSRQESELVERAS